MIGNGELKIEGIKKIAEITICGALHIYVNECDGHTDFIVPTPEQRKNLKEMLCIDVKVFDDVRSDNMTESEARLILDVRISRFDHAKDVNEALEIAKQALKEIQQYRKFGTLEELDKAKKYIDLAKKHGTIGKMIDECAEYEEIGTVEECRKAVEKQKPKPCEFYGDEENGKLLCPNCGEDLWDLKECGFNNCPYCGQEVTL